MIISTLILHISELGQLSMPEILLQNQAGNKGTKLVDTRSLNRVLHFILMFLHCVSQKCGCPTTM